MLFPELDLLADAPPASGAWNMALDEALTRLCQRPLLRIYRWKEATVSFGYFEKLSEVRSVYPDKPLIRRWTGGGMVEHGSDWTYSLIIPTSDPLHASRSSVSYAAIHQVLREFLQSIGWSVELVSEATQDGFGCFQNPVASDLLLNRQKVAGAAQRRTRHALLHQGSIQRLPVHEWQAMHFARYFCPLPLSRDPYLSEISLATELEQSRYGTTAWLERI